MTKRQFRQSKTNQDTCPFVCHNMPFVSIANPMIIPSVDILIPFVGIRRNKGFTMIELLIALAIAGILAAIAMPAFQNFIKDNRLKTRTSLMISHLQLARSESAKQKSRVTVCTSSNGTTCTPGTDWDNGWIVWTEKDGVAGLDPNTELLLSEARSNNVIEIDSGFDTMDYLPDGTAITPGGGGIQFTFCDDRTAESGRQITIALTGRAESERFACP